MNTTVIQKIRNSSNDVYILAEKYYNIISVINGLTLTPREIQLIAFAAIHGSLSSSVLREEFCEKYETTIATINNVISKLKKKHILVKDGKEIRVNPVILVNFNLDIVLEIKLEHADKGSND